jgi:hypothetical protein
MPYCKACSTQYDDNVKVCKVCGNELVSDEENSEISKSEEQNEILKNTSRYAGYFRLPLIKRIISTLLTLFKSFQITLIRTILNLSILKPLAVFIFSLFFITGSYWGYIRYVSTNRLIDPKVIESHEEVKAQLKLQSSPPDQVFDLIKKANIRKDIDLFMSCFSPNFKLLDSKKANRLKIWNKYDYNSLKYHNKGFVIIKDKASGLVEWEFYARQKNTEKNISAMFLYNVVLEKDNKGTWKILHLTKL